jgi:hypothetical protein
MSKTYELSGPSSGSKAYALISNHVTNSRQLLSENSKQSISKARPSHPDSTNSLQNNSLNTSFKLAGSNRSYRSPKTPQLSNSFLGNSSTKAEENNKQSKKDLDLQLKVDDIRYTPSLPHAPDKPGTKPTSAKLAGRSFTSLEEPSDSKTIVRQNNLITKRTDSTPKHESKEPSHGGTDAGPNRRSMATPPSHGKIDSKLSIKLMMSPPLVVFGGQNAVRLDPLLTRKSTSSSGSPKSSRRDPGLRRRHP